jgi:hypothetical protein
MMTEQHEEMYDVDSEKFPSDSVEGKSHAVMFGEQRRSMGWIMVGTTARPHFRA